MSFSVDLKFGNCFGAEVRTIKLDVLVSGDQMVQAKENLRDSQRIWLSSGRHHPQKVH